MLRLDYTAAMTHAWKRSSRADSDPDAKRSNWPKISAAVARTVSACMLMLGSLAIVGASGADALADSPDVTVMLREAESGDARAAFLLGMRYARPEDSSRDDVEAVRWLRQAAQRGLAEAQYNLGIMYAAGRGVAPDAGQAADWYRQAAEQGLARAQYNLGAQYAAGDGVPRDEQRAAGWFERAALQDIPEAAYNLGVLYDLGRGVDANTATAMKWYERAAKGGYHPAASRLAALRASHPDMAVRAPGSSTAAPTGVPAATSTTSGATDTALVKTQGVPSAAALSASTVPAPAKAQQAATAAARSASPWLAGLDSTHYTLQVLSHTDEAGVQRFLEDNFDAGSAGYFAFELDGKTWYSLVYGDYPNHARAIAAAERLAERLVERLGGQKPWVRKIAIIQKAALR